MLNEIDTCAPQVSLPALRCSRCLQQQLHVAMGDISMAVGQCQQTATVPKCPQSKEVQALSKQNST